MKPHFLLLTCMLFIVSAGVGCNESTTVPEVPTDTGSDFRDVPPIPTPSSPGGSVPAKSSVHTTIHRLNGDFLARLERAQGTWYVDQRLPYFNTKWTRVQTRTGWSTDPFGTLVQLGSPLGYAQMTKNGQPLSTVNAEFFRTYGVNSAQVDYRFAFAGSGLGEPAYLRRDRQWELKTLEGGVGDFLLLEGNAQGTVSTSYTRGSSKTSTEEFGRSLTVGVGLSYGPLSASVSGTLSQTFSSSVTVEESRTETFEKSVSGEPGKIIQFQVWELVDTYSFCDASGAPLEHVDYYFDNPVWVRHGAASFLQTTAFDK